MKVFAYVILLLLVASCADEKIISIDLNIDTLTIDNKVIDRKDFEKELKRVVDSLVDSGLEKSMIDIHVEADKQISTYEMSEIEKAIRRQGVTREYIWTD